MSATPQELEGEIVARRERLEANLNALESRVKQEVDWRTHFLRHTPEFLAGAAAGGFLLALMLVPRPRPRFRSPWA